MLCYVLVQRKSVQNVQERPGIYTGFVKVNIEISKNVKFILKLPVVVRRDMAIKICLAELSCERMRGRIDSRYEQFQISPETIEQELRPVVCEQRQTDSQADLGIIIV